MTDLVWPVAIICIALVSVVIRVTQVFVCLQEKRKVPKTLATDVSCQTDFEHVELVTKSESAQTVIRLPNTREVSTETLLASITSVEMQTEESVYLPKVASSVGLPPTPSSTVESSFDLRASLEPPSPSCLRSEELAFDTDMDIFLKSAMSHVLTEKEHTPDCRPRAQTCTWFSETMDQYASLDDTSTVVGGEIYRTISDHCFDDSSDNILANLESILETDVRPLKNNDVAAFVSRMTRVLSDQFDKTISLVPFGSLASGLMSSASSVDLVFLLPLAIMESLFGSSVGSVSSPSQRSEIPLNQIKEYESRLMMRKALQKVGEVLAEHCGLTVVKLTNVGSIAAIGSSKIPTLTLVDPNQGRFEITCNNLFPLFSTRLVKTYVDANPQLGDLILLVKFWAIKRKLIALSGFSWTLLCIFYCQAQLQVIPSLQGLCSERKQWKDPFGSRRCDVSFLDSLGAANWGGLSGASLFIGFVDFFANYWNWPNGVVSVRLGRTVSIDSSEILIKQNHTNIACANNSRIHIEDPFDSKKDLAGQSLSDHIRKEFINTSWALNGGNPELLGNLFESLRGNQSLRNFTPLRRTVTSISETPMEPTYRRSESCQ